MPLGLRPLLPPPQDPLKFMASLISIAGHRPWIGSLSTVTVMLHVFAGLFEDGRLVIAVTHFDEYNRNNKYSSVAYSSVQEVKEVVSQMIRRAVDVSFPEERVIPVCGLWAFYGRQLRCNSDDKDLKKECLHCLEKCYSGPRGEDKEIPDLSFEEMAETLETSSNIKALETQ